MKKFISIILCLSMLIASAPAIIAAQGDTVPSAGAGNVYHSESDMSSATESANTLYELGLFNGISKLAEILPRTHSSTS